MTTYILFNKGLPVHLTTENPFTGTPKLKEFPGIEYDSVKDSWDYKSLGEVYNIADFATKYTGETYLGFDRGGSHSPRYGIVKAPKVGDDVSFGFNGDYYPCGKITRITKGWRVTATDECGAQKVFNRRKETSSWRMVGGTWTMVRGIVDERNPHF